MIDDMGYLHTDANLYGRIRLVYTLFICLRDQQVQETLGNKPNWMRFIVTASSYIFLKKARVLTPEEAREYNNA